MKLKTIILAGLVGYAITTKPSIKPPAAIAATRSRYRIKKYTRDRAKKIGVTVKPSNTANYKLDVFKSGALVGRVGDIRYFDYPTYMAMEKAGEVPAGYAKKRRKLYKKRHQKTRLKKWSRSWLSDNLLW